MAGDMYRDLFLVIFMAGLAGAVLHAGGRQGYTEYRDDHNYYNYQEPQYHDAVPITPYESANTIYYDYSPYLEPNNIPDPTNPN